jgi:hypothetical protein
MRANDLKFEQKQTRTLGGFPVTVLDVDHQDIEEANLKPTTLAALQQAKQNLEQQRAADMAAWEQDFRANTTKMAGQQLKKRFEPVPVAQPGERHSALKARINNLNQAIQKKQYLDNVLRAKAEKAGILNEPEIKKNFDTSMYIVMDGPNDDYVTLNQHLDTAIKKIKTRMAEKRAAYAQPKQNKQNRMAEEWSQKYKSSINCSHPKGFSQRAHCAGKRKHNESVEMVCKDCGMCQTHGSLNEIKKGQKDSNGVTKCWPGKHAEGTKKGKNGGQVRNCVPNEGVEEAIKLNAPQRRMPRDELQGYADRIKTGTKTKRDKFAPIIHGSNIRAITKDEDNTEWDLDDLAKQITTRPRAILGTNAKMEKSATEGEIVYDLTLPALSGVVVDEETGDFVEITTCPGAGACQLFCYARKGGYVMFPASSMSAAQALNFLVNDPEGYSARVNQEIQSVKKKADKHSIQLVVRWHDAGDFFSKEYLDLAFEVARANPDVEFYAYTKIADVATANKPNNFIINFSSGSKRGEEKKVDFYKSAGNVVKQGVTVPKDMFFDLIARDGTKLNKDAKGRTQFKDHDALNEFKRRIAQTYKVNPATIITYDQMLATPVGTEPKWNVIVQPGAGDRAANRKDVIDSYLMFH